MMAVAVSVLAAAEGSRSSNTVMPLMELAGWCLLLLILVVAAWKFLVWLKGVLGSGSGDPVAAVVEAAGAGRWFAMVELVNHLARNPRPEVIASAWERIEMLLHEAQPDCPPSLASAVVSSLDRLHGLTAERSVQKRIMALRNRFAA
jgi:hypothetical protein